MILIFFQDIVKSARSLLGKKEHLSAMPLQPFLPDFPFSKWGLDFIGPINPPSLGGQYFILTTTNYFTKWTEVVPLKHS
jgi:hypothetical protein